MIILSSFQNGLVLLCQHVVPTWNTLFRAGGKSEHTAINVPMFQPGSEDNRKILGDATDTGLLRYCDRLTPSSFVRMAYKKVCSDVSTFSVVALLLSVVVLLLSFIGWC